MTRTILAAFAAAFLLAACSGNPVDSTGAECTQTGRPTIDSYDFTCPDGSTVHWGHLSKY